MNRSTHLIPKADGEYEAMKAIYRLSVTGNCYKTMLLTVGCKGKKLNLSLSSPLRHTGAVEVQLHSFLILALGGDVFNFTLRPLYPSLLSRNNPGTH